MDSKVWSTSLEDATRLFIDLGVRQAFGSMRIRDTRWMTFDTTRLLLSFDLSMFVYYLCYVCEFSDTL